MSVSYDLTRKDYYSEAMLASTDPKLPFVSVVIPVYNRPQLLQSCLTPLLRQSYPLERYEIIVVDDGSTDDTGQRAEALLQSWEGTARVISKPNGGPASARNAGLHLSTAEVIVFIDSDCIANQTWLTELITALQLSKADGIGAPVVGMNTDGWVSRYVEFTGLIHHRVKQGKVAYLTTPNTAFLRSSLLAVNGFDERGHRYNAEDADLSFRLLDRGFMLAVTTSAAVQHEHRQSVTSLFRTLYYYGRGNYLYAQTWKNGRSFIVESIRHLGAIALSPLLTLLRIKRAGLRWALAFWPLTIVDHAGFTLGLWAGFLHDLRTR